MQKPKNNCVPLDHIPKPVFQLDPPLRVREPQFGPYMIKHIKTSAFNAIFTGIQIE